jgi:tetratricopeptide (TPR) repeat protein
MGSLPAEMPNPRDRRRSARALPRAARGHSAKRAPVGNGSGAARRPKPSALPRDVIDELRRVAKPGSADDAIGRLERATALLERGDAPGAVREAQKAKQAAPRSGSVREVIGMAHYAQERFGEALRELQAYRRLSGRADQNHLIADCLRARGRGERIMPLVEEALRARIPNEVKAEAAVVGASALADQGRYEEGLAVLRRAKTDKDVGRGYVLRLWYVAGDILERAGRREEAAREFRKVTRHDAGAFDAAERLAALG